MSVWPGKVVICLAVNGLLPTRRDSPHLPVTPREVADEVLELCQLGVAMVHLHARDQAGRPSYKAEDYARIIELIRMEDRAILLSVSTSARLGASLAQRQEVLALDGHCKPDFASLTLGSLNFPRQASINSPDDIMALAASMRAQGIRPELEIFDTGMLNYVRYLESKGLIKPPFWCNLILGGVATAQVSLPEMAALTALLPAGCLWTVGGLGRHQLAANAAALVFGGGVRVGLEDNLWWDQARTAPASNKTLVARVRQLADTLQRPIATPAEIRQWLEATD